jgi:condensin complex subunit 2
MLTERQDNNPADTNLSHIIDSVKIKYPDKKADEISVSFYFICLLHLANERNLKIEGVQDLSDLRIQDGRP